MSGHLSVGSGAVSAAVPLSPLGDAPPWRFCKFRGDTEIAICDVGRQHVRSGSGGGIKKASFLIRTSGRSSGDYRFGNSKTGIFSAAMTASLNPVLLKQTP